MLYCYKCNACGAIVEDYRMSAQRDRRKPCRAKIGDKMCGGTLVRDQESELERSSTRKSGELPDWTSVNSGVMPSQVDEANRAYAHLDVTFDKRGNAHVPGRNRMKFLKARGLLEL